MCVCVITIVCCISLDMVLNFCKSFIVLIYCRVHLSCAAQKLEVCTG